jgi:hypothetical protein
MRTVALHAIHLERGQYNAGYVVLTGLDAEGCELCLLLHEVRDVARRVRDLGEREGRDLHDLAHLPFRLQQRLAPILRIRTARRTSSTLRRIARKRVVSASRFLDRSECPVCAPFSRSLVFCRAARVGNMFSRLPEDMVAGNARRAQDGQCKKASATG